MGKNETNNSFWKVAFFVLLALLLLTLAWQYKVNKTVYGFDGFNITKGELDAFGDVANEKGDGGFLLCDIDKNKCIKITRLER